MPKSIGFRHLFLSMEKVGDDITEPSAGLRYNEITKEAKEEFDM